MSTASLPHAIDVEKTVLSSMLISEKALYDGLEQISSSKLFYHTGNQKIFSAITKMVAENKAVDIVTLSDSLEKFGELDAVGGAPYLAELQERVATTANIEYYVNILVDKANRRKVITGCHNLIAMAGNPEEEIEDVMSQAVILSDDTEFDAQKNSMQNMSAILPQTFAEIEAYTKGQVAGIPTGFKDLDEITGGLGNSDLIIIAARPSMGKTALALSMALHGAKATKKPVALFSLEMSKSQMVQRALCSNAMVNMHQLRAGKLPKREFPKLSVAAGELSGIDIYIDDTPGISPSKIITKCRRIKNLGAIFVDYLQLMSSDTKGENRQQEITNISRALKNIAKKFDVPVGCLSQLSRAVESRPNKRPQLSDLRESGAIEQDADVVMFVYRDEYYNAKTEEPRKAEIIIGKQRNGPVGTINLDFDRQYVKFSNYVKDEEF